MPRLVLAILLLVLTQPARALDCKTAINQFDLNECAGRELDAADAALNAVYRRIVARLGRSEAGARARLVAAQRAWVAFRNAECDFTTMPTEGGMAHPMEMLSCRESLTAKRTAELKAYLSCSPDESDCPVPAAKSPVPRAVPPASGRRTPAL